MVEDSVRAAFRDVLELQEPVAWDDVRHDTCPCWDSLVHMALVARLEADHGIELTDDDIVALDSAATAVHLVQAHLEDGSP